VHSSTAPNQFIIGATGGIEAHSDLNMLCNDITQIESIELNIITPKDGGVVDLPGKLNTDDICANTIQVLVDMTVQGNATVEGKLTVDGLIDPTGLVLDGQTSSPVGGPGSGQGAVWVDSTSIPSILVFEDDTGNIHPVSMADNELVHGNLTGLAADDHTQYALLAGRDGGQVFYGGISIDNTLALIPNSADLDTGNVIINGTIDSTSSITGALVVDGGLGVSKNMVGGQAVAGGFATIGAADAGITLPDNVMVCVITPGTATGAFAVTAPTQTIVGQVLHVYNSSIHASIGIITMPSAGATIVSDGSVWYQL
jgi:hypothetical protein